MAQTAGPDDVLFKVIADTSSVKEAEKLQKEFEAEIKRTAKEQENEAKIQAQKQLAIAKQQYKQNEINFIQYTDQVVAIKRAQSAKLIQIEQTAAQASLKVLQAVEAKKAAAAAATKGPLNSGLIGAAGEKLSALSGKLGSFLTGGAVGVAISGIASKIGQIGSAALDSFFKLEKLENRLNVIFGDALPRAKDAADQLAASQGLTNNQFLETISFSADLLKPLGQTSEQALDTSLKINQLAAAQKAFNNDQRSLKEVTEIFNKALLGERDGLISFGLKLSDADVKQKLVAAGKDKLTGSALKLAIAEVTLAEVTRQSSDALQTYGQTAENEGRKFDKLKAGLETGKTAILAIVGGAIAPFVTAFADAGKEIGQFLENLRSTTVGSGLLAFAFQNLIKIFGPVLLTFKAIGAVLSAVFQTINSIFTGIERSKGFQQLIIIFNRAKAAVVDFIGVLTGPFKAAYDAVQGFFKGDGKTESTFSKAITAVTDAVIYMIAVFKQALSIILPAAAAIGNAMGAAFSFVSRDFDAAKQFAEKSKAAANEAKTNFTGFFDGVKKSYNDLKNLKVEGPKIEGKGSGSNDTATDGKGSQRLDDEKKTTEELLIAEQEYLAERAKLRQDSDEAEAVRRQDESIQEQIDLINRNEEEKALLTQFEEEKFAREAELAAAKDAASKKALKREIDDLNLKIKAEKQTQAERKRLLEEEKAFRAKIANEIFALNEALLSQEKGSFLRFLAGKISQLTEYLAKEAYLKSVIAFASGNIGQGLALGAAGLTIQAAGSLAAGALNNAAKTASEGGAEQKTTVAPVSFDQEALAPTKAAATTAASSATTINNTTINNVDSSLNVDGSVLDVRDFFNRYIVPAQAARATEQGKLVLATRTGSG